MLDNVNNSLYEVELAKAQIEHKEPIFVRFFIPQYAKMRMLKLYYNFFNKFCYVTKFEELEMDTDSLYLAPAEKNWKIISNLKRERNGRGCDQMNVNRFTADVVAILFPRSCCVKHEQHDKRETGLFKEEFRCTEMLCLCSEIYYCYDVTSNKLKFSSKGLNKRVLGHSGDGPLKKYRTFLNEKVNVTPNNRRFRTNNESVSTCEQFKKFLSYFYSKRVVESDRVHIQPPNL